MYARPPERNRRALDNDVPFTKNAVINDITSSNKFEKRDIAMLGF